MLKTSRSSYEPQPAAAGAGNLVGSLSRAGAGPGERRRWRLDTLPPAARSFLLQAEVEETRWEQPPSVILIIGHQNQAETSLETSIHSYQAPTKVQDMRMFPAERGDQVLVLAQPSHQQIAPIITSNMLADLTIWMENILT